MANLQLSIRCPKEKGYWDCKLKENTGIYRDKILFWVVSQPFPFPIAPSSYPILHSPIPAITFFFHIQKHPIRYKHGLCMFRFYYLFNTIFYILFQDLKKPQHLRFPIATYGTICKQSGRFSRPTNWSFSGREEESRRTIRPSPTEVWHN